MKAATESSGKVKTYGMPCELCKKLAFNAFKDPCFSLTKKRVKLWKGLALIAFKDNDGEKYRRYIETSTPFGSMSWITSWCIM